MPTAGVWFQTWVYLGFLVCGWAEGARPRFDTSTDMGLVLVPADAEVDSVIFRLRATDQDADFPLIFEVTATITPVVRIDNLPCTLYNKVCQANVILTKRLMPGRLHDFAVRVRDTKGDSNSMQATISATNATTSRDKIFPHIPSLIMVPEDTKPGTELDYILVRANSWSGKPVYIELWQPKELFTIRQRQTPTQTRGVITLIGELDFETQSMYTLTIYATDPYTEPGKDTRNIAGLNIVVIVQDVQDEPPIFTLAPPLTRLNNSVQIGDVILRVHAEDGDKGVPREITYGLVSEGNPFTPFFNISETTGEIILARPLEELTQITHVGAPVVLSIVAEEIRRSRDEPPAQATVVEVGFLLGEPGNSPPYFENDNYVTSIPENLEPGTVITFPEQYSTRVHDEDIGKAGVFALKLQNNNGTFEINPTVAERTADFVITVRDNTLIDYEMYKTLSFKIIAQEVGPATNLSASAGVTIFIEDVNDNPPVFDEETYVVTLSENVTAGTRVIQVHATDEDTGLFGSIKYTGITGEGSEAFAIDPDTGLITVAMGSSLDREMTAQLQLTINARDENGKGNLGQAQLIVNLLDVNDNAPIFEKDVYEFTLNSDLTNFTAPAFIKATDADAEPPNNEVRYELIHGNYENKFYLDEITGELILRSPITKFRRKKQSTYDHSLKKSHRRFLQPIHEHAIQETATKVTVPSDIMNATERTSTKSESKQHIGETKRRRRKRETDVLYTLTARAYDLGVPHLSSEAQILILRGSAMEARIMMFVVPGERPNLTKTAETLATITGGRVTVLDTRPYVSDNRASVTGSSIPAEGKRTIVVARVEQTEPGAPLVDVEKIRNILAANGVGIIGGTSATNVSMTYGYETTTKPPIDGIIHDGGDSAGVHVNKTISSVHEEVTVYKAENKLLFWLLIILGLLMLLAIAALIICCICPGCPFYMAPRKRRVYSSELIARTDNGRPKRHIHRKPIATIDVTSNGKKQAWSADPTRRNWQFNRRNTKNDGLASLPGDVVYISERLPIDQANTESLRLRDGPAYDPSRRRRLENQEIMCMEDVEERKARDYEATDVDSLQRHEVERSSDILHPAPQQRYVDLELNEPAVREQHFYREGNAEVLQLVTRGQVEDDGLSQHYPTTVVVDGKDVLLQRFMQDQKGRHEVSMQEPEVMRIIESHQRRKNLYPHQQEILLLPEALDFQHRRTVEAASSAANLPLDDSYEAQKMDVESHIRDIHRHEISTNIPGVSSTDRPSLMKDQAQSTTMQSYAFHDLELARQNALLTRLLLERESRHAGGVMMDAASYLETQSLPGQVAIATQTDRVAATQTEQRVRSRSDNDESDEDGRNRKKVKMKKRYDESETKRTRMLWMKSPIEEEENRCFDKRLNILRKKVKEVKEGRKASLEPGVLREISDSLDENGGSYREKEEMSARTYEKSAEENGDTAYKVLSEEKNGSSTSVELNKQQYETISDEKRAEISSSPEISLDNGKYVHRTTEKKCSKKESRTKKQKKVESIIRPSFRILEREITMLTKKLSKLADKKQPTTGDESTSQERSKDIKRDSDQSTRKTEDSKDHKRAETSSSPSKETAVTKTRQKFKYQPAQMMSPGGSSEYDDTFEKAKKTKPGFRPEVAKHVQTSSRGQTKVKRQSSVQIERKEHRKQIAQQDRKVERQKDTVTKEGTRAESKAEKTVKLSRAQKLAAIGRRDNVLEEASTSTSSDQANSKKDTIITSQRESDKKSTLEIAMQQANRREPPKRKLHRLNEKFTDDFVTELQTEDIDQENASYRIAEVSMPKDDFVDGTRETEIAQQFSDDFATPPEDVKYERLHDLEHTRSPSKSISSTAKEQAAQLIEDAHIEQFDSESSAPLDSPVPKILEKHQLREPLVHCSKCATGKKIVYTPEKRELETCKSPHEIEKDGKKEEEEVTAKWDVQEQKSLKGMENGEKEEADVLDKRAKNLKVSSDITECIEQEEERTKNGSHNSTDESPLKEDTAKLEDVADSYLSRENKAVELFTDENDLREKAAHESEEHGEKDKHAVNDAMEIERKITEESVQREVEGDILQPFKSDVEKEIEIIATSNDGQDVTEKLENISEKRITRESDSEGKEKVKELNQEFDSEKIKKDVKTETIGKVFYISQSLESERVNSMIDIQPVSLIDESDKVLTDVDKTAQEILNDNLLQIEPGETIAFLTKEDDLAETQIESYEIKEESHVKKSYDSREEKLMKIDEDKRFTIPAKVATFEKETTDSDPASCIKTEDKAPHEKHEEKDEEPLGTKEKSDERVEEKFDEGSIDNQLPKDSDFEKSAASQPDKSETINGSASTADPQQQREQAEQQVDVSDPIFTSFIDTDTLEVSEESDSSSDISRKTTVTTRPYDTPRHRQKWQQQESLEIAVMSEIKDFEDKKDVATIETEPEEDTDSNLSLNEAENIEDSVTIEAPIGEKTENIEIATEKFLLPEETSSINEKISDPEKLNDKNGQDEDFKLEEGVESIVDKISNIKDLSTTIRDETPSLLSVKKLNGTSKEKIEDDISIAKEETDSKMKKISESVKLSSKEEISSPSKQVEQASREKIGIEDAKVDKIKTKNTKTDKATDDKNDIPSTFPEEHVAKVDSSGSLVKRKKKLERSKAIASEMRKHVLEEEPEGKATPIHPRRRSHRYTDDDSEKRARDSESQKQSRKEEEVPKMRKTLKSKTKVDKKSTIIPKTGEINVSKTQSKYMAWYNKKREEAEKKKLEKKALEDDEQLPRWVSRGLKHHTAKHAKQGTEYKTPEMTPRTRRKIKPLVNVESEQLKAIVRQGRQLRKIEGNLKEDPPIQIYARTPPVSSSVQHRLVQHSEYKYEKMPPPFYLHPPPPPHPSPQLSPERSFEPQLSTQCEQPEEEAQRSDNATTSLQAGSRLRHQQLLEKKSVFDIAYSEAAPSQLRSDSTTPPS